MNESNLIKLTIGLSIVFACACAAIGFLLFPRSAATTATTANVALNTLKLRARQAENSRDAAQEDVCYLQALEEAKKSGTKTDVLEILSRLVRERAYNQNFDHVDPYVKDALDIVKPLVGTSSYDREMSVWMDDLADVFIDQGKRASNERVKDYCARRYLDIELLVRNKYSQQLKGIASLRITSLADQGRYDQTIPIAEALLHDAERNHCSSTESAIGNLVLATDYLATRQYDRAEATFRRYFALISNGKDDKWDYAAMESGLSIVDFEKGDSVNAIAKCKDVFEIQNRMNIDGFSAGASACVLAYFNEHTGNLKQAKKYFQTSLEIFATSHPIILADPNADPIAAGRVVAAEHLADIETKTGNTQSAFKLRKTAQVIRAQHPNWSASKNPDPMRFYLIFGHLPFPIEVIPTRVNISLH
jgi:tetratricopeptide (TPR) repeat protein